MFEKFIKLILVGKDEAKSSIFEPSESCTQLLSIIASIRSSLDIDETFRIIIDEILKILDVPSVSISEYTDKNTSSSFKIRAWRSERPMPEPCELDHAGPQYIAENLFKNGKIFLESDIESSDYPECVKNNFRVIGVKACVCVPVKKGSDIWGFISVSDYKQRNWEKFEVAFLEAIADQIYEAVKQAQMYSDLKEQKNKESALKKITEIITKSIDTEHFLYEVCREIAELFCVQRVSIGDYTGKFKEKETLLAEYRSDDKISSIGSNLQIKEITRSFWCKYVIERGEISSIESNLQIKEITRSFWCKYVIERGEISSIDNFEDADIPDDIKKIYTEMGVKSFIGVPLKEHDKSWGGLFLSDYKSVRHWSDADKELLDAISEQVYMAVRQVELFDKTKKQAEGEKLLRRITDTIRSSLDIEDVKNEIVREIGKTFKTDRCFIRLYDENGSLLPVDIEYLGHKNAKSMRGGLFTKYLDEYFKKIYFMNRIISAFDKEVFSGDNLVNNDLKELFDTYNIKASYGIPIFHSDKPLGSIVLQWSDKVMLSGEELDLLRHIAHQAAITIKQSELYMKATQANKLKSDFIAAMSHEFRTPLNAIIGFSEMLLTDDYGKRSEKQSKFLNNIALSGKNLLNLVNEILDISKIESGNVELNIEKLDSGMIIRESVGALKCLAEQKSIKLELDLDDIYVFADSGKFKQILNNLLSNAVKFTPDGGKIKISSKLEKTILRIAVEDSGIGISGDDKENVFSEFKQASFYQGHKEGTGLGLALTKKLVELHNGTIDFESEEGKGSKFWFLLPKAVKMPLNKRKK